MIDDEDDNLESPSKTTVETPVIELDKNYQKIAQFPVENQQGMEIEQRRKSVEKVFTFVDLCEEKTDAVGYVEGLNFAKIKQTSLFPKDETLIKNNKESGLVKLNEIGSSALAQINHRAPFAELNRSPQPPTLIPPSQHFKEYNEVCSPCPCHIQAFTQTYSISIVH